AVAEPERDHAVADLVEDDGDDQTAEEDDRFRVNVHGDGRRVLSGASTRTGCRGAPPASPRGGARGAADGTTRTRRRCRYRTWPGLPRYRTAFRSAAPRAPRPRPARR